MRLVRKIYSLIICLALILACVPVQASASESAEIDYIDVLSYDYPDDSLSVRGSMSLAKPYNVFDLPFSYGLVYFDIIFETSSIPSSVGIRSTSSGNVYSLTLASLGNNRYRAYGQTSTAFNSSQFAFQLSVSDITGNQKYTCTYYKFYVYTIFDPGTLDTGEIMVIPDSANPSGHSNVWYSQTSPGVAVSRSFYYDSDYDVLVPYDVYLSSVNWRQYDYLDFSFYIQSADIQYINVFVDSSLYGKKYLPFEFSYINPSGMSINEYVGTGSTGLALPTNYWEISLRVYIPRDVTSSGSLKIHIGGDYGSMASWAQLRTVTGYYYTSVPSPDLVKLDQITAAIKESLSSSAEDNSAAEDFSENMSSQKEQMASNQQTLNNVSKPSTDDLGMMVSPDAVLNADGMTALVSIINPITDNDLVLGILTLSATLALVSYVFFGKKR